MLCSGKSGSSWLDRLRSTKGFLAGDHPDLDHFLSNPQPPPAADASISEPDTAPPSQRALSDQTQPPNPTRNGDWYGAIMSNVLSELFNMGHPNDLPRKKFPRKQTNPRICSASRAGEEGGASAASLGSGNNSAEVKEESVEHAEKELFGYSRSEVTVIDTSCEGWKFEKLVFRRKSVWKVRDRKGKLRGFVEKMKKKKRKLGGGCDENVGAENKKMKVLNSELRIEEGQNPNKKREGTTRIERPHDLGQYPKNRISFSRSPRKSVKSKSGKRDSFVALMKGIPRMPKH